MKRLLLLSLTLMICAFANAQKPVKPSVKETHPLNNFYGEKMYVKMHTKDNASVAHQSGDYVIFHKDGSYAQDWNGVNQSGTWSYNKAANSITITIKTGHEYTIEKVESMRLTLKAKNESLILEKQK